MNKYQEALNKLKRNFKIKSNTLEEMIIVEEDNERQSKVLQKAIDKAIIYDDKETVKKVKINDSEKKIDGMCYYICSHCNRAIGDQCYNDCSSWTYCTFYGGKIK